MMPQSAEAAQAIRFAQVQHPDLGWDGFYPIPDIPEPRRLDANAASDQIQVATAIAFLRLCPKTQRPHQSSYSLKHQAERWGRHNNLSPYVANGALLIAAIYLAFPIKREGHLNPNAQLGVSLKSRRICGGPE